jgi:peptide/nickel transport system substrate-binding protein
MRTVNRRAVLRAGLASIGATAFCARLSTATVLSELEQWRPEGGRVVVDPTQFPTVFHEAPALAELVRQGRLPPVGERIGQDPLIIAPLHEIGKYGGTPRRAFTGVVDNNTITRMGAGPDSFLYWDRDFESLVPNIARAYDVSSDGHVLMLYLRRGMHWSDGAPFTADDVMFWYEDMYRDLRVVAS